MVSLFLLLVVRMRWFLVLEMFMRIVLCMCVWRFFLVMLVKFSCCWKVLMMFVMGFMWYLVLMCLYRLVVLLWLCWLE